jgi:hypothetical protein
VNNAKVVLVFQTLKLAILSQERSFEPKEIKKKTKSKKRFWKKN